MKRIPLTIPNLQNALARTIKENFPSHRVWTNPVQETSLPAWFIVLVPTSRVNKRLNKRVERVITFDIIYRHDYQLVDCYDRYVEAIDILDSALLYVTYSYTDPDTGLEEEFPMATYNVNWQMSDESGLRYNVTFKNTGYLDLPAPPLMESMDLDIFSKKEVN